MKLFMITGIFFQVGRQMPQTGGICGALYAQYQDKVISSNFSGVITCDENNGVFTGKIQDKYGPSSLIGTFKKEEGGNEKIFFERHYRGGNSKVNYQLTKTGEIYLGHFQVEGYGKKSEGWVKCRLTPVEENFFQPEEFMIEINAEIERRKSL